MLRTFVEHAIRPEESLNGIWEFVTDADRQEKGRLPKRYTRTIHVPSSWESLPGLENYRGKAWLRTRIYAPGDHHVRLVFGGVSHTGTVFVDGKKVGTHYDAFTPWDVVVPGLKEGEHELVVEVDNSFGDHSALHVENDYYTYGGITRPVKLQYLPDVFIDKIFATPRRKGKAWDLDVRVRLRNVSRKDVICSIHVDLADAMDGKNRVVVKAGASREIALKLADLKAIRPWSPEVPQLYELDAYLGIDNGYVDDLTDRVGFRVVEVKGKKILLNGKSIRLRGFNRHEDHPQFGCALPLEAMVTDLEMMRDLGCNFVRTCHYPNDMRFLDLCDEMGFYVWEESHARGVTFTHPMFDQQIADSTREMVEWHFNRPSIVMWGCLNECDSVYPAGVKVHARVLKQLKTLDPSRPTTFASNKAANDACLRYADIVSWNRYDAWYRQVMGSRDIEPALKDILRWLHSPKSKGGTGKPVILSEFGAGAIYGNRQRCASKWSEEYQAEVLDESLRVYLNHPDVVGAAIWQYCDVRITATQWGGRPRTMNNKGVVDEYRRSKLACETVRKRMLEAAKKWDK